MSVLYWVVPEKIRTSPTEEMENDPPPFGHPSTAKPPPPPQTAKPKIIHPPPQSTSVILNGLINLGSNTATTEPPEPL